MNGSIHRQPDFTGQLEESAGSRFLTLRETAAFLNVHPNTVRSQVRRGQLPGAKVGRGWRFFEPDLVPALRARYPESRRDQPAVGGSERPWRSGAGRAFMLPGALLTRRRSVTA